MKSAVFRIFIAYLLIVSLTLSLTANFFLFKYARLVFERSTPPLFKLDDEAGQYRLEKVEDGTYIIELQKGSLKTRGLVGSTQIPLDEFNNKRVRIIGEFRPILGFPTCYKKCVKKYYAPVIDIESIILED